MTRKSHRFSVVIERDEDGYFAFCPELQGCYTQGETYEEVLENVRDAIRLYVEDRLKSGEEIPHVDSISLTFH
jgi:predicted RNase H-like HicB family nuclease